MSADDVDLSHEATASFQFRVNPSNARFNYDVNSPDCEIAIDKVGTNKNLTSGITIPEFYSLVKVEPVCDEQGLPKAGQYRAFIKDSGISDSYRDVVSLVISVGGINGDKFISSEVFNVNYSDNVLFSFKFELSKNKGKILDDIELNIDNDEITLVTPRFFDLKGLVPTIETNGKYVFANGVQQVPGVSSVDFSNTVTYTIVSSVGARRDYKVALSNTGLPIVVVETENHSPIVSRDEWLANTSITIFDVDGSIDYQGTSDNIRGRGNSTWQAPKKPFAVKLDKKAEILGMPKHKRWVLLANWLDRTILRNDVAFELSRMTGMDWTPRGQFVEVILNGEHIGNYYLCEQIKIDKNRVNIAELKADDVDDETITGGYLMELDSHFDEVNKFMSSVRSFPYMFKDPDEETLNEQQFAYMQGYVNQFETELYNADSFSNRTYINYIDIDSYIQFFFVNEIVSNHELGWPRSTYVHKDRNGKMKAGPVWDFDWGTFSPDRTQKWISRYTLYYGRLAEDPQYVARMKELWNESYPRFLTIGDYIDSRVEELRQSQEINMVMWPITEVINGDESLTFDEAVERVKTSALDKIKWMNTAINNM